ncbi:MAG: OmpA family protein [Cytophagaceae bacterium]|jgi:peptidoglycan-associated lipoprotein|nr:OmpA family protein [Cytophagaceae bacterium]
MKRFLVYIICLTATAVLLSLQSCGTKNRLGNAKKVYDIGEYNRAVKPFQKAYRREKNRYYKGEASFYMGESYRAVNQPKKAAAAYVRAMRYGYTDRRAKLYLAQSLLKTGEYAEAEKLFDEYLREVVGDRVAYNGLTSAKLALNPPPPENYSITQIKRLNSRYSDYSPILAPDDPYMLYFSSMRRANKKNKNINRITGQGASVIYVAHEEAKGEWKDIEPLFEQAEEVDWEDGVITFTPDGKEAYFTRARYEKTAPTGAEIWNIKRSGGKWGEAAKVVIGADSLTFAHPSISPDGNTLYFASDIPGGFGGKDIWKAVKAGDGWSPPVNLGIDINTPGDEMFPYIKEDSVLYFSSDGQVGFGGLDIYRAKQLDETRWDVRNAGLPINSSADDFGISYYPNRDAGFFSSSRNNAKGYESIYYFERPTLQVTLSGSVDAGSKTPVPPNTVVRIVGTDGANSRINIESTGTFNYMLQPNVEYLILTTAPEYFNKKTKLNTYGLRESRQYNVSIELQSVEKPLIFDNIEFESGKWELTNSSREALSRVVALLNENPTIKINIAAHTDAAGDEAQNIELSQKRADAVKQFLTEKGINGERLSAIGHGGAQPLKVNRDIAEKHNFLKVGDELVEPFIQRQIRRNQPLARGLNNRVEFSIRKE